MSFDPYGPSPEQRPPLDPTAPIDLPASPDPAGRPPLEAARDRVQLPGIFLLVIGLLNVLPGFLFGYQSVSALMQSPDAIHDAAVRQSKVMRDQMNQIFKDPAVTKGFDEAVATIEKTDPAQLKSRTVWQNGLTTLAIVLIAGLQVFGGVRMLQLRWYALSMIAAIVSAVPCLSLSGCCCIGQAVGIWAIVVLLNSDVRAAFR